MHYRAHVQKKLCCAVVFAVTFWTTAAFATVAPPLPLGVPQSAETRAAESVQQPTHSPDAESTVAQGPHTSILRIEASSAGGGAGRPQPTPPQLAPGLTKKELDKYVISSATYYSTLYWLNALSRSEQGFATESFLSAADAADLMQTMGLLRPELYTVVYNRQLTSNNVKDVEPSTVVQQTSQGTFAATTYIERRAAFDFSIMSRNVDHNGNLVAQQLPFPRANEGWQHPAGYRVQADPLMSLNPYDSGYGPRYVYTTGITHAGAAFSLPSGIALWHSTDGGRNWSFPTRIAETNTVDRFYDKPSITVCWYSVCLGEVFVAYTFMWRNDPNRTTTNSEIRLARLRNNAFGIPTVVSDSLVVEGWNLNASQVLVDPWRGHVNVIWADYSNNRIVRKVSAPHNYGAEGTWGPEDIIANTALVTDLVNGTTALSVPMARFNWVADRVNVVWHAYEAGLQQTQVLFATKGVGTSWVTWVAQGVDNTNDQLQPALDLDGNGNVLISYLSRRDDTNTADGTQNQSYRPYSVIVSADGSTVVRGEQPTAEFDSWANDPDEGSTGWIGDYHDVWFTVEYNRFNVAWPGLPTTSFEIFLTGVQ